jgi:hypothetical protein
MQISIAERLDKTKENKINTSNTTRDIKYAAVSVCSLIENNCLDTGGFNEIDHITSEFEFLYRKIICIKISVEHFSKIIKFLLVFFLHNSPELTNICIHSTITYIITII